MWVSYLRAAICLKIDVYLSNVHLYGVPWWLVSLCQEKLVKALLTVVTIDISMASVTWIPSEFEHYVCEAISSLNIMWDNIRWFIRCVIEPIDTFGVVLNMFTNNYSNIRSNLIEYNLNIISSILVGRSLPAKWGQPDPQLLIIRVEL